MEKKQLISQLIDFITNEPACIQALECLDSSAEVAIQIAESVELSVQYKGNVIVEERKAYAADFRFSTNPETIEVLIAEKGLSPAQLGTKLVKLIISGDIALSMPGSLFQVPRKGYFKMLAIGGTEFLKELRKYDLTNVAKILGALKRLKKS